MAVTTVEFPAGNGAGALIESGGATLAIGSVPDGTVLYRSGTSVLGATLSGLSITGGVLTNSLTAGVNGGQTIIGGTLTGQSLTLQANAVDTAANMVMTGSVIKIGSGGGAVSAGTLLWLSNGTAGQFTDVTLRNANTAKGASISLFADTTSFQILTFGSTYGGSEGANSAYFEGFAAGGAGIINLSGPALINPVGFLGAPKQVGLRIPLSAMQSTGAGVQISGDQTSATPTLFTGAAGAILSITNTGATYFVAKPSDQVGLEAFFGTSASGTVQTGSSSRANPFQIRIGDNNGAPAILQISQDRISYVQAVSITDTSATASGFIQTTTFAPTSGTAIFRAKNIVYTINQTGGANGACTGLYLNATETALVGTHDLITAAVGGTNQFRVTNAGKLALGAGSFAANGAVATVLGALGPAGASVSVRKWHVVNDGTGDFYSPLF